MNRRRIAFLLLALAALLALAVILRDRWLPGLLAALTGNAQLIDTLESVVSILGALATAALAGAGLLGLRRPSPPPPARLVQPVSLDALRARFRDLRQQSFGYIDRGATGGHALTSRLVIIGPPKVGKSREAVELIGRALEPRHLLPARIFQPTTELRAANAGTVARHIHRDVGEPGALLLFIDDLPYHFRDAELETLAAALPALERCGALSVVATARADQLTDSHRAWLARQRFATVEVGSWAPNHIAALVDDGRFLAELPDDEGGRAAMIAGNDGTPELTRLTLLRLADVGRGDRETVEREQRDSYVDAWRARREELIRRAPAVEPLLWALAVFYAARVTPYTGLVLALAARRMTGLWRAGRLRRALPALEGYVGEEDAQLVFADYVAEAEGVAGDKARREMEQFLLGHRRWLRFPGLRRLYPGRERQAAALFDLALASDDKAEAESIIRYYTAAIGFRPFSGCLNNRGVLHATHGRPAEALADYTEASRLDPTYATAFYNRGFLHADHGRPAEALADYDEAIRLNPANATAFYNRANLHDDQGRPAEALADYTEAIRLDPTNAAAFYNRGLLHANHGRPAEALADFSEAIRLDPADAAAFYNRGLLHDDHDRPAEALDDYSEAIRLDPTDAMAFNNRGGLFRQLDRPEEAARDFERVAQLGRDTFFLHLSLAGCYRDLGRAADMERHLALARERVQPDDSPYNRACLEAIAGNDVPALDLLAQALAIKGVEREWVRRDPDWKPLRDHPRFRALVEEPQ